MGKPQRWRTWAAWPLSSASCTQMSSPSRNALGFALSLMPRVLGIKASFLGTEQRPGRGSGHVVLCSEGLGPTAVLILLDELLEAAVVDPRPPLPLDLELGRKQPSGQRWEHPREVPDTHYHPGADLPATLTLHAPHVDSCQSSFCPRAKA